MGKRVKRNKSQLLSKQTIFRLIQLHQDRLKAFGIRRIGLFGSFVRGDQRHDTDIDFLVESDFDQKTYDNFINAIYFLEELLGRDVEIITREGLSPFIGPSILAELEDVPITS